MIRRSQSTKILKIKLVDSADVQFTEEKNPLFFVDSPQYRNYDQSTALITEKKQKLFINIMEILSWNVPKIYCYNVNNAEINL